jgi:hypothetical protein
MFWLVLIVSGTIVQTWGPTPRAECEARKVVMAVDKPPRHAYECVRNKRR